GLLELVAELLGRNLERVRHGLGVEVEHEAPDQQSRVADARGPRAAELAALHLDVVDRPVLGVDAQLRVGPHHRLDEQRVEVHREFRSLVARIDEVREELVAIEIDCAATHVPPQDRQSLLLAELLVDFLFDLLMDADANIRFFGARESQYGIAVRRNCFGHTVIDGLAAKSGDHPEVQDSQSHASLLLQSLCLTRNWPTWLTWVKSDGEWCAVPGRRSDGDASMPAKIGSSIVSARCA